MANLNEDKTMSYYEEQEMKNIELIDYWYWVIKWVVFILFFMWLGSKLNG